MISALEPAYSSRAAATERRIVESARHLLAHAGMEALTMRAVAAEAGITSGAIYRHFLDKSALVERVLEDSFSHYEDSLWRGIAPLPVGSLERLVALGRAYLRFARENQEHFKVLFSIQGRPRDLDEVPGRGGFSVLKQCVSEAMDAGSIRRGDAALVSLHLWSRVHGIVMLLLACDLSGELPGRDGRLTPEDLFDGTRELMLQGLQA